MQTAPAKHPASIEPYFFIWCDKTTGLNDGSSSDKGELQGATIATIVSVTADSGLTVDSSNKSAVTIQGVSYGINTVVTAWLSGGTDQNDYRVTCKITTSDSRTLSATALVPVRSS